RPTARPSHGRRAGPLVFLFSRPLLAKCRSQRGRWARGIAAERVHLIPNWSDDEHISPVSHADNPLRQAWGLADKFVVGYSGNLGRAHEFETVLSTAERLRGFPIVFLFVGGGHQFDRLAQRARQREVRNFQFMPYQDAEALKYSLGVAHIHLLSLPAH